MRTILACILLVLLASCENVEVKKNIPATEKINSPVKFYSKEINDSFYVFISCPENMDKNKKYPVVYLTDANLYFDVMKATFDRYSEIGLLPEAILVGVGYKDFKTMDSLRERDLTYPVAVPEYEMRLSGNADKFLGLIQNDVVPYIDSNYPCYKTKRVLMGHSLGGYFTLFALKQDLAAKKHIFTSYIAASPSTDFNHNYILNEFDILNTHNKKVNCYVTFGGLEDSEEDTAALKCSVILKKLTHSLKEKCKINYKGDLFSSLDHMDTSLPTFIKGLQMCLMTEE
jgi:predicted alpha/beta superfamily hydrolase